MSDTEEQPTLEIVELPSKKPAADRVGAKPSSSAERAAKVKKERTPAQKEAMKKALDALAAKRSERAVKVGDDLRTKYAEQKAAKEEKEKVEAEMSALNIKQEIRAIREMLKSKPTTAEKEERLSSDSRTGVTATKSGNNLPALVEGPTEPKPAVEKPKPTVRLSPDSRTDVSSEPKTKPKPKAKAKKVVYIEESESSSSEEEVVMVRRKKKDVPPPTPPAASPVVPTPARAGLMSSMFSRHR